MLTIGFYILDYLRRYNFLQRLFSIALMSKIAPIHSQDSAIGIQQSTGHYKFTIMPPPETTKLCKICLDEEIVDAATLLSMTDQEHQEHQMVVPCECSGSMGYVHQKCIRTWIQKQFTTSLNRRSSCEICKSPIFFKSERSKYLDCKLKNLTQITCCNVLSAIVQLFLITIIIFVLKHSEVAIGQSPFLMYVLVILMAILCFIFFLTIAVMFGQAFVRSNKFISRIYSIEECYKMGLIENRRIKTTKSIRSSRSIGVNGSRTKIKARRANNSHIVVSNTIPMHLDAFNL